MEVVVTTGAISSCKAPVKSSSPTNQHPVFLQAGCPSCRPTNSVKALKGKYHILWTCLPEAHLGVFQLCLWPLIAPVTLGEGCHASHQPSDVSTPTSSWNCNENIWPVNPTLVEKRKVVMSFSAPGNEPRNSVGFCLIQCILQQVFACSGITAEVENQLKELFEEVNSLKNNSQTAVSECCFCNLYFLKCP